MSQPTSKSAATVVPDDDFSRPSTAIHLADHGDPSTSDTNYVLKPFRFSFGNPRIGKTKGVMHLFHGITPTSSALPVKRKPILCVLGVPNYMTYTEFCQFCGSSIQQILEMRIVRNDRVEDQYSVLIRFIDQNSADTFHQHFNGMRFSSLEVDSCHVLFTMDVYYTQSSTASSTEQPSCPVCHEMLDQEISGILTTICNHSFHCSCLSKWTDSSCPVCRYCQQQSEITKCFVCETSENVWICLLCGFVGCGSYKEGHAIQHWKETHHSYSLELETKCVWDYVGENYVHRLIQSKIDRKLVEHNNFCSHINGRCGLYECIQWRNEALLDSKVEAFVNEYDKILDTQLEKQRTYFESLLQEVEEETEREISVAIKNSLRHNTKLRKMQAKLDKAIEDKQFQDDINETLLENKNIWEGKIKKIEEREKEAIRLKDEKLQELGQQVGDMRATHGADRDDETEEFPISYKFVPQ